MGRHVRHFGDSTSVVADGSVHVDGEASCEGSDHADGRESNAVHAREGERSEDGGGDDERREDDCAATKGRKGRKERRKVREREERERRERERECERDKVGGYVGSPDLYPRARP